MRSIVIGTAGHIDHGKTSLVKALTGIDTDRLKEEKERGITIELGFAHLDLDGARGLRAGIVDVPGHERFVKNMVAGTTGIDLVMLVVAADEGVMPQTREHVDICNLLSVKRGLVALTKTDLITDETWLQMVVEDLRAELAGSFLAESLVLPVSARTGAGLNDLKRALATEADHIPVRPKDAPAFLGIDRAFSMHGFGTVVTGTLVSGILRLEEAMDVLPDPARRLRGLKIRGLQVHGEDVPQADAGQRVAVNLAAIEKADLNRGQVLVHTGSLETGSDFECSLQLLAAHKPLRNRFRAILHTGTAKSLCRVRLIGRESLEAGEFGLCSIHCQEPVAALPGHHFILRGFQPLPGRGTTFAGGRILGILPPRRRKDPQLWAEELAVLDGGQLGERLLVLLRRAGSPGASAPELRMRTGAGLSQIQRELDKLMAERKVLKFDREQGRFLEASVLEGLCGQAVHLLGDFHEKNPLLPGMPVEQLRTTLSTQLDPRLFRLILEELRKAARAEVTTDAVHLSSHRIKLSDADNRLTQAVRARFASAGLSPPRPAELAVELKTEESEVLELVRLLTREGFLTHISQDMYVPSEVLAALREKLIKHLIAHAEINTQDFKSLVGGSRKHVIPLAEYFDREKTTLRVGEKRVLRRKSSIDEGES